MPMIIRFKKGQEDRGLRLLYMARINFAYRGDGKYSIGTKQRAILAVQKVGFSVIR